jgi:hypothetical protein
MATIKHEKEIDSLMRELFYDERFVTEDDYQEIIEETFATMGITKQQMSDEIEVGIGNGYSVGQQIEIIKNVLKSK